MTDAGRGALPLAGLRVLDFSHAAAGPFTTMLLGDMGAEVIKLERIGAGDGARSMGVPMPSPGDNESDYYVALNRNKQNIALDLGRPEGQAIARDLAARSDVVIQNFRPGVMDRLGLGFDDLRALRPGLVYCSISAFGPDGPWATRPANDIILQSVSGLMGITGEPDRSPVRVGAPVVDYSAGLFALSGLLAALVARPAHPEGQHVEVSMLDSALNMMCNYIPSVATLGARVTRSGGGHPTIVPYQTFRCSDGAYVMIGAFTRGFWESLARALGRPDWLADPRFSSNGRRLKNRAALVAQLEAIFLTQPRDAWIALLEQADVPVGPVLELHDAIQTEQVRHSGAIVGIGGPDHPARVVRSPIRVGAWGPQPLCPAPELGAQGRQVLASLLGYDAARIDDLDARGVIAGPPAKPTHKEE